MITPETPSQNQPPDAPEPVTPALDASAQAPAEPTANGHEGGAIDGPSDESPNDAAAGEDSDASASTGGAPGSSDAPADKKRRRRRRKRKPGGPHATGDSTAPQASEASADAAAPDAEGNGERDADRQEKKKERKDRKPGPPRERPPVNGGDIVFGKIIEITDEAILVDIPGKAHAIFDRREMLLPDDDEPSRARSRPPEPVQAGESVAPPPEPTAEGSSSVPSEPSPAAEPAPGDGLAASATPEAPQTSEPAEPEPVALPPQPIETPADAATESHKDPKVPRVILEVGADFIGVVHNDGARGGLVVLTHHPHRAERAKPVLEKAFADKTLVSGLVTGVIKGGIEVDVDGLRAFAPGSHVDLRLGADLSHLVAKRLPFTVTQYAKRGRDVVLSRKAILEEEAKKARTEALARLKVGEELEGVVRSVVPFGAFVDVGGVEGLVPLQEMSHNRADGPSDVFKAGASVRVKVVKIDDRGKIWLSRKATIPDPWQKVAEKYAGGTRHAGKVVRLQPFGAFVELEPGVDGLIHTQDLSLKRIETPEEVVKAGDAIDVVVAHVDPSQHKIALHPAPQGDAAADASQKVAPHRAVKGKIVQVESGGLLIRILGVTGRNARGYVTAAATGTPRGTELRKVFNVGQEVEAKVIEIDPRRGEVKLSIKALSEDQERSAYQQYRQQLKAEARFTFGDLLAKKGKG